MSNSPRVVSLFSGAGGIDYGLEAAGFRTAVALDSDHDCCQTLRTSRPSWGVIERSIADVPTEEILEVGSLRKREVDLLVGGPPCQPFSKASYWRGDSLRLDDPRAHTLAAYMRVVEEALPHVFLIENVEGLAFTGKDEGLRFLMSRIAGINKRTRSNYTPVVKVMSATDYGVPQQRKRVIMIAARDGTRIQFPEPTHRSPNAEVDGDPVRRSLPTFRTAWDAIADVRPRSDESLEIRGKWADLLPSIPEGANYLHHTNRGEGYPIFGWRKRYWPFLLKLAKARPSWTILAQPGPAIGPFHWDNRRLSIRELCRIQTFPDNVEIVGGRASQQRQIGNAVPSLLAEVLGREIATQLLGGRIKKPLQLLPIDRSPAPPPEPLGKVPGRYRDGLRCGKLYSLKGS